MKKEILYSASSYLRDDFNIVAYRFGKNDDMSEPAACIVGSMRGNEYQQMYICSLLVKRLKELENHGAIVGNNEILIIPCINNFSMNVGKKYWVSDNSDINRQFPGNFDGEPTSRLAANFFDKVKGFRYGIHFPSFYRKGDFIPHVRMPSTGKESTSLANLFGLPYVITSKQRNFDKTTLNYNWQINGTDAFSIYSGETGNIDEVLAKQAVSAVLRFLTRMGILKYNCHNGYIASIIEEEDMILIKAESAGFFRRFAGVNEEIKRGQLLGEILDPYEGTILSEVRASVDGIIFYASNQPTILENATAFQVIKKLHE
ncbi:MULTISPECIES: M14 family metallopeptidase [Anaerostipes]|uniref:M14 family metallopeptidase n=1 Tax=Anaerostipes TaxID=207244 RepID=UPI000951979E|nr:MULTISPECIES: M14 family metallopeptidase [Anaerostipes]MDY2726695.1 M14 family metallopeptidase [Anaerostipes faecalis]OLR58770.1 succinylglutamate desuccinylase [Anaerostipes sp. 494a]